MSRPSFTEKSVERMTVVNPVIPVSMYTCIIVDGILFRYKFPCACKLSNATIELEGMVRDIDVNILINNNLVNVIKVKNNEGATNAPMTFEYGDKVILQLNEETPTVTGCWVSFTLIPTNVGANVFDVKVTEHGN